LDGRDGRLGPGQGGRLDRVRVCHRLSAMAIDERLHFFVDQEFGIHRRDLVCPRVAIVDSPPRNSLSIIYRGDEWRHCFAINIGEINGQPVEVDLPLRGRRR
jgi:hypothetical protein